MVKNHLKRINAPKTWPVKRKSNVFIAKPNAGAHSLTHGMALTTMFKEVLKLCKTSKEVVNVINHKGLLVDGKKVMDKLYSVGLYDSITVESTKENFRVALSSTGKLAAFVTEEKDAKLKPCKIKGKTLVKGGQLQLNFTDGKSLLVDKNDYKVGDTLILEMPSQKIVEHVAFEKGVTVQIVEGKYAGCTGEVVEIVRYETAQSDLVSVKTADGEEFSTLKEYAFIVGKKGPAIKLGE